jgi:hypothetical protein
MLSFDFPQICTTCRGYKTMPLTWNSTGKPPMCTCPKVSLSWECHRCGKINAPWKGSCDCTPPTNNFPYGNPIPVAGVNAPTYGTVTQGYPISSNITNTNEV